MLHIPLIPSCPDHCTLHAKTPALNPLSPSYLDTRACSRLLVLIRIELLSTAKRQTCSTDRPVIYWIILSTGRLCDSILGIRGRLRRYYPPCPASQSMQEPSAQTPHFQTSSSLRASPGPPPRIVRFIPFSESILSQVGVDDIVDPYFMVWFPTVHPEVV